MINWRDQSDKLLQAVIKSVENLTFAIVEPQLPNDEKRGEQYELISSSIDILSKEKNYTFIISVSTEFIKEFVENTYRPTDKSSIDGLIKDTIGELANTVIGNISREIEEFNTDFTLSIPKSVEIVEDKVLETFNFIIDDTYIMEIRVFNQ